MDLRVLLFGVGSTALGYLSWRSGSRASSLIRGTATSKIGSAAKGFAEVTGRARALASGALRDPITHQHCVWFAVETEKYNFFDKGWKTIKTARSSSPFVIDDGSGRCLVYPGDVEIDRRKQSTIIKDRWNLRHKVWWIREDEPVFAIGYLRRISDAPEDELASDADVRKPPAKDLAWADEQALNLRATEILRRWKRDPRLLARFDANQDGKIDPREWEAVRDAAHAEAAASLGAPKRKVSFERPPEPDPETPEPDVTHRLMKPPDGRPFLLTKHGEGSLVSSSRSRAFWGLVFFIIGVIVLVSMLQQCVGE